MRTYELQFNYTAFVRTSDYLKLQAFVGITARCLLALGVTHDCTQRRVLLQSTLLTVLKL